MIKNMKPLSLAEAKKIVEENGGNDKLEPYFKKFAKLNSKEALKLREELEGIKSHKLRQEYIAKVIDLLPIDASDINKIFTDISLDENEIKQITDIVAKYK